MWWSQVSSKSVLSVLHPFFSSWVYRKPLTYHFVWHHAGAVLCLTPCRYGALFPRLRSASTVHPPSSRYDSLLFGQSFRRLTDVQILHLTFIPLVYWATSHDPYLLPMSEPRSPRPLEYYLIRHRTETTTNVLYVNSFFNVSWYVWVFMYVHFDHSRCMRDIHHGYGQRWNPSVYFKVVLDRHDEKKRPLKNT